MTPTCINLRERLGEQYRIGFDEAAVNGNTPWMQTIPCRFGTIYPYGGDNLAVEIDGHNRIAKRIGAVRGVVLHQDGVDEKTFVFPVSLFDQVAAIVEPQRAKRLTDEQKAKLREAGEPYRFKDGAKEGFPERQAPEKSKGDQEAA